MRDKTIITVIHGEENHICIADIYDKNDFFHDAYSQASLAIESIVENSKRYHNDIEDKGWKGQEKHCHRTFLTELSEQTRLLEFSNNMIVFSGDRGQGKTSAMLSMGRALEQMGEKEDAKDKRGFWGENTFDSRFLVLPAIDPTAMEEKESIIKVVLSRMLVLFREEYKEVTRSENKSSVLELFRKCYKSLAILKDEIKQEEIYDDLQYLSELGDSTNLKTIFFDLVQKYLSAMSATMKAEMPFLVVQIDDVDLNIKHAYSILEDLRKYCTIPNVIILLSCNLNQLREVLENDFAKEYEILLHQKNSTVTIDTCFRMQEDYIRKVFPKRHQIFLPKLNLCDSDSDEKVTIQYLQDNKNIFEDYISDEYQEILLRYIYDKTGIIIQKRSFLGGVLPKTMRELTQFLEYMSSMCNLPEDMWKKVLHYYINDENKKEDADAIIEKWRFNLKYLESYLLAKEGSEFSREFLEAPLDEKVSKLEKIVQKLDGEQNKDCSPKSLRTLEEDLINIIKNLIDDAREKGLLLIAAISLYKTRIALFDLHRRENFPNTLFLLGKEYLHFQNLNIAGITKCRYEVSEKYWQYLKTNNIGELIYWQNLFFEKENGKVYFNILAPLINYIAKMERVIGATNAVVENNIEEYGNVAGSILQIMLNVDVRNNIQKAFDEQKSEKEFLKPSRIIEKIYRVIDDNIDAIPYLGLTSRIADIMTARDSNVDWFYELVFLCNDELKKLCIDYIKMTLAKEIPTNTIKLAAGNVPEKISQFITQMGTGMVPSKMSFAGMGLTEIMSKDPQISELLENWNKQAETLIQVSNDIQEMVLHGEKRNVTQAYIISLQKKYNDAIRSMRKLCNSSSEKNNGYEK